MTKTPFHDVVQALKSSLRDLENVNMIAPDDLKLLGRKREIQKKIERAEQQVEVEKKQQ